MLRGIAFSFGLTTLLMSAHSASASEWLAVSHNDRFVQFVDAETVTNDGAFLKVWSLSVYRARAGNGAKRINTLDLYDCEGRRTRLVKRLSQRADGTVIESEVPTDQPWDEPVPGSAGEALWRAVCSDLRLNIVDDPDAFASEHFRSRPSKTRLRPRKAVKPSSRAL